MQKLVVLTGAGISAESGLKTFRDADGLWEGYDVMDVASPLGWKNNPALVLDFYNQRRKQVLNAHPNLGHTILKELEDYFKVTIITQNVDDLHEKSGSTNVIHLHGHLFQSRSTANEQLIYKMDNWQLDLGDKCELGAQLRPNIVWFGETVPMMDLAIEVTEKADILLIVGTSMQVYPAAGLIDYVPSFIPKYIIDPNKPTTSRYSNLHFIEEKATIGLQKIKDILLRDFEE